MAYFGNTQQKLKLRINQHLAEVCALVNKGKTSDSFAKYFASHYPNREEKLGIGEARSLVDISIEWQGKPISCCKSFGKLNCSLCMKERLIILEHSKKDPTKIINSSNEFYGACRHIPKFHRYPETTTPSVLMTNRSSEKVKPQIAVCTPPVLNTLPLCIYIPDSNMPVTVENFKSADTNSEKCLMDV